MGRNIFFITYAFIAIIFSSKGYCQSYSGKWNRVSLGFTVNIKQWGKDCGSKPKSYYSKQVKPVIITEKGGDLFFSNGSLRTDTCNSPNPRLVVVSKSKGSNQWHRICETPKTDSKYEKSEYTFIGEEGQQLVYTARSHFNWSLKNDHCVISWIEKQVFKRVDSSIAKEKSKSESALPVKKSKQKDEKDEPATECGDHGPPVKVTIHPKKRTIGPSSTLCFKLTGVDKKGCRFSVPASWQVRQSDKIVHLITPNGCFHAGDTAAEAEGVYSVTAVSNGKSYTATVTVAFPDIGDLARARLDLASEMPEENSDEASTSEPSAGSSVPVSASLPGVSGDSTLKTAVVLIGSIAAAGLILIIIFFRRRKSLLLNKIVADDKKSVIPSLNPPTAKGMVCPKCHRGYDDNARFCPHDSTKLIPYEKWRQ
jgi:hypothetical protein